MEYIVEKCVESVEKVEVGVVDGVGVVWLGVNLYY